MKTLLLIDANSFIHRAFHALPPLTAPDGRPTGALFGLANSLFKVLRETSPDFAAAAFDRPEPTFRKKEYEPYKAHRPPAPDELRSQIREARNLFDALKIKTFEAPGYEADDILGTLIKKFEGKGVVMKILTGDLDTLQLVKDATVVVETPKRGAGETVTYNEDAVQERFGLPPTYMTDYKGLVGDASDNIPGVPGIGPKTATKILKEYGSLEKALKDAPRRVEEGAVWKKLAEHKEQALLSKRLATLDCAAPIETTLEELAFIPPSLPTVEPYFISLGFQSLVKRLGENHLVRLEGNERGRARAQAPQRTLSVRKRIRQLAEGQAAVVVDADDLVGEALLSSPLTKVAFAWKPLLKKLQKQGRRATPPLFDVTIAAWLVGYAPPNPFLHGFAKHFLEPALRERSTREMLEKLYLLLTEKMQEEGVHRVFQELEMPLIPILASMENCGILVNRETLERTEKDIERTLQELTRKIYDHAGISFNINSPRELGSILFEKLNLKPKRVRKTPLGQLRTNREVLAMLRYTHPIIPLILRYREDFKIKTGFLNPLMTAQTEDQRIHTTFLQTGTATGRLASKHPNLQNIPQESRWAEPIRNAFESAPGWTLVSLDYSQLELRLLAHVTGDERLKKAFEREDDIHRLTATAIFGAEPGAITPSMRRIGKTLNFGIIYGMGARSLSETAGISRDEAEQFIQEYFKTFPRVREWQTRIKEEVALHGFVENANGRKRWFPKGAPQGMIERAAINMPLQSLGADIIKKAMIDAVRSIDEKRKELAPHVRLLLSIHDELLFEVRDDILTITIPLLKKSMENAFSLSVPLIAEAKIGKQWGTMRSPQKEYAR